jgi:toxin-antitoxin system PIN domain toxin
MAKIAQSTQFAGDLLDTNVWLALMVPHHPHHGEAQTYWQTGTSEFLVFCRQTQIGLMRLLGNSAIMNAQPHTPAQSWAAYTTLSADRSVKMWADPPGLESEIARLTASVTWPAPMWSDAYLAAFAKTSHLRLVSFDRDFSRFPGLHWLHLTDPKDPQ